MSQYPVSETRFSMSVAEAEMYATAPMIIHDSDSNETDSSTAYSGWQDDETRETATIDEYLAVPAHPRDVCPVVLLRGTYMDGHVFDITIFSIRSCPKGATVAKTKTLHGVVVQDYARVCGARRHHEYRAAALDDDRE